MMAATKPRQRRRAPDPYFARLGRKEVDVLDACRSRRRQHGSI